MPTIETLTRDIAETRAAIAKGLPPDQMAEARLRLATLLAALTEARAQAAGAAVLGLPTGALVPRRMA